VPASSDAVSRRLWTAPRVGPSRRPLSPAPQRAPRSGAFETTTRDGHSRQPLETAPQNLDRGSRGFTPRAPFGGPDPRAIPPLERRVVPELLDPIERGHAGARPEVVPRALQRDPASDRAEVVQVTAKEVLQGPDCQTPGGRFVPPGLLDRVFGSGCSICCAPSGRGVASPPSKVRVRVKGRGQTHSKTRRPKRANPANPSHGFKGKLEPDAAPFAGSLRRSLAMAIRNGALRRPIETVPRNGHSKRRLETAP